MPLTSLSEILQDALRRNYAVGAFNVVNLEFLEAILDTAEALRSPVIVSIAEVHFPYVPLADLCLLLRDRAGRLRVPVALHLDHGMNPMSFLLAIRDGFTSVMFDGSKLPFAENVKRTREVVDLCRPLDISVEAELGSVGGDEGGGLESQADPSLFTDPDQAQRFVEQTGINALAVAVGNAHGKYKGEPRLDFERLQQIREKCGIPLVLHGGSGISGDDFRRAIRCGICKINIYTALSQAALKATADYLAQSSGRYHDYPLLLQAVRKAVAEVAAEQMTLFGSTDRA